MGSKDAFFEALGPTSPPPNDSPGFFTHATGIFRGADIVGTLLGIKGTGTDPGAPGVVGQGGLSLGGRPGGNGVFGQGLNGIVGYTQTATRNTATEVAEPAGVFGVGGDGVSGGVGVRGEAVSGNAGVLGRGRTAADFYPSPGVRGVSDDGAGVDATGNVGVSATGTWGAGVEANSKNGPGIESRSIESRGGVFHSEKRAQIQLVPNSLPHPAQLPQGAEGDLFVTLTRDPKRPEVLVASLWFCTIAGTAGWKQIA